MSNQQKELQEFNQALIDFAKSKEHQNALIFIQNKFKISIENAEDLLQDVYLSILRYKTAFINATGDFNKKVFNIIRKHVANYLEARFSIKQTKHSNRKEPLLINETHYLDESSDLLVFNAEMNQEKLLQKKQEITIMRVFLSSLRVRQREALLWWAERNQSPHKKDQTVKFNYNKSKYANFIIKYIQTSIFSKKNSNILMKQIRSTFDKSKFEFLQQEPSIKLTEIYTDDMA